MCRLLLFDLVCFEITWYFSAIVAMPGCSKVFHLLSGTLMRHRKTVCFEGLVLGFGAQFLLNLAAASCRFIASLGGRVRCKHPFIGRRKM